MKYLITPTLLNALSYYLQDEFKSPADSRADFLKVLTRDKFEPNQAMQKGIELEDDVRALCEDRELITVSHFAGEEIDLTRDFVVHNLANIVEGGLWQQSVKKDLMVGNQEFLLYGKCDVIKRDTIYDIKFTNNYESGKYVGSSQHLIYLYCLGLPKFSYLISDGKEWWREDYFNHEGIGAETKSKISEFLRYLDHDQEAKDLFLTKWKSICKKF